MLLPLMAVLLAALQAEAAAAEEDGRVLIVGVTTDFAADFAELYDPATGEWSPTASMRVARRDHVAALLPDGRVLVAGGIDGDGATLADAEIYDPATGAWSDAAPMPEGHRAARVVALADGRVLVSGGQRDTTPIAASALYDPRSEVWTSGGAMTQARHGHAAVVLADGAVFLTGGTDGSGSAARIRTTESRSY
jgi:hypothetical protein